MSSKMLDLASPAMSHMGVSTHPCDTTLTRIGANSSAKARTTGKLTDFLGDGIDVAVRYGSGNYPGLTSEFLTGEEVFPVCGPRRKVKAFRDWLFAEMTPSLKRWGPAIN